MKRGKLNFMDVSLISAVAVGLLMLAAAAKDATELSSSAANRILLVIYFYTTINFMIAILSFVLLNKVYEKVRE